MIDANGCLIIEEIDLLEPNVIYPIIDFNNSQLFVVEPTLANPTFGIPPYFYQWYDSNGLILGAVDSVFEPSFIRGITLRLLINLIVLENLVLII